MSERRQALKLVETAYLAGQPPCSGPASITCRWVETLFRLAPGRCPLPCCHCAQGWRCGWEGSDCWQRLPCWSP